MESLRRSATCQDKVRATTSLDLTVLAMLSGLLTCPQKLLKEIDRDLGLGVDLMAAAHPEE
jgi:hypothetical protein